jgi:hypothetical protein
MNWVSWPVCRRHWYWMFCQNEIQWLILMVRIQQCRRLRRGHRSDPSAVLPSRGTQIYFDPNNKSSSGKMIPMEIATHKNHTCDERPQEEMDFPIWCEVSSARDQRKKRGKHIIEQLRRNTIKVLYPHKHTSKISLRDMRAMVSQYSNLLRQQDEMIPQWSLLWKSV